MSKLQACPELVGGGSESCGSGTVSPVGGSESVVYTESWGGSGGCC